ncbi:ABC transporter substrate-binding protein, partial [Arthrospira sp. O9.13F]
SFNPAYSQVLSDNIWGQVIRAIVADGISPEQAADRAIAQIEGIFSNWEQ